jgi:predicted nucleic acid-binding protein
VLNIARVADGLQPKPIRIKRPGRPTAKVAGILGILGMAARHDLLNLADAFDRLERTSFHYRQEIMDQFLAEQGGNG